MESVAVPAAGHAAEAAAKHETRQNQQQGAVLHVEMHPAATPTPVNPPHGSLGLGKGSSSKAAHSKSQSQKLLSAGIVSGRNGTSQKQHTSGMGARRVPRTSGAITKKAQKRRSL